MVAAAVVEAVTAAVAAAAEIVEIAETVGRKGLPDQGGACIPEDAAGNLPQKPSEIVVCPPLRRSLATFEAETRLTAWR
jgi:hypothetical protein